MERTSQYNDNQFDAIEKANDLLKPKNLVIQPDDKEHDGCVPIESKEVFPGGESNV